MNAEATRAWWWPVGRRLLAWRYRLFQTHRHNRLVLEQVMGRPWVVLPEVFNPVLFRSGALLAERLGPELVKPGARVLDMGTGSGVGAVFAARWAGQVVAVDINPAAVRCARINALLQAVEARVDVREGDLFAPVAGERFDLILFNPPYYAGAPRDALDRAFRAPDIMARFAAGLDAALAPGGRVLLVVSTDMDLADVCAALSAAHFSVRVWWQKELINERVVMYLCEREGSV